MKGRANVCIRIQIQIRSSVPSFLLILFSLALLSSCRADLIGDFCAKTNNPNTCAQIVRANPKSRGTDPRGLAGIAVEDARRFTADTIGVAKSVPRSGIEGILDGCVENFNLAVATLESCRPLIDKRDRSSVRAKATAALTEISLCGLGFAGLKEPQRLKDATGKAYVFAQLLLLLADAL